jgi:hypothetical protein
VASFDLVGDLADIEPAHPRALFVEHPLHGARGRLVAVQPCQHCPGIEAGAHLGSCDLAAAIFAVVAVWSLLSVTVRVRREEAQRPIDADDDAPRTPRPLPARSRETEAVAPSAFARSGARAPLLGGWPTTR